MKADNRTTVGRVVGMLEKDVQNGIAQDRHSHIEAGIGNQQQRLIAKYNSRWQQ
jgi:hypothetical protein